MPNVLQGCCFTTTILPASADNGGRFSTGVLRSYSTIGAVTPPGPVEPDCVPYDATSTGAPSDTSDQLRILFVCTARPDLLRVRPDWGGDRRSFSSLPLDALSAGESALLVSLLLEIDSLPDSTRDGILEEIPEAYKDVDEVIEVVSSAGLARKVARLRPMGVIKG